MMEDELESSSRRSTVKVPDTHLQSAIRRDTRDYLISPLVQCPGYLYKVISSCPVSRSSLILDSEQFYGRLFSMIYDPDFELYRVSWIEKHVPDMCAMVADIIKITEGQLNLPPSILNWKVSSEELLLLSIKVVWEDIRLLMQQQKIREQNRSNSVHWVSPKRLPPGILNIYISAHYLLARISGTKNDIAFDYDQVMMITDTITSRVQTIRYNLILPAESIGRLETGTIYRCYRLLDGLFPLMGNRSYQVIATWESCVISVMLTKFDRLEKSKEYGRWFLNDVNTMDDENGREILRELHNTLLDLEMDVNQYSELHGIYRHWGHPTVQEELGCIKVKQIAKNRPIADDLIRSEVTGALKRQFVVSYISHHGHWPPLGDNSHLDARPISGLLTSQSRVLNLYSPEYSMADWGQVRFGKVFEFDYHPDFTDLIDDKSCSVKRSELRSIYAADKLGYRPSPPTTERRVLLETLSRHIINIKEYCTRVQFDIIPHQWKIILIHAKERELKLAPRLFAMMVLEMRLYFCVTESNIAKFVFKYFPQQTMTLDESELLKRLLTLTNDFATFMKYIAPILGIDFTSWNVCWTYSATWQVFQFLDDLFGTPGLYLHTHKFFEECLVALASHCNPPASLIDNPRGPIGECETLWYNHLGGFEGLRQKGWTFCTIGVLLLVEFMTGIKSYVLGQGDNQVCKLILPIPDDFESVDAYLEINQAHVTSEINRFIASLQHVVSGLGLAIKQDETWAAVDLMIYGKEMIHRGSFLSQGIKRISRLFPDVNEIYPNLYTQIATMQTAGLSAALRSFHIAPAYYICTVEIIITIIREANQIYKDQGILPPSERVTPKEISYYDTSTFRRFLLFLCADVGSCPLLPYLSFWYRGHPDPLTTYLTNLSLISKQDPLAMRVLQWMAQYKYKTGSGSEELLISNPCALNLESPLQLGTIIKDIIYDSLLSMIKNNHLRQIFSQKSREHDLSLFKYLLASDPIQPRLLHEVFRQTITGTKLSFISKFSNTRTTQLLISKLDNPPDMLLEVRRINASMIKFWAKMYEEVLGLNQAFFLQLPCPTQLAQQLRDDTWTVVTGGRPIEGVTIPHPAHQFSSEFSEPALDNFYLNCRNTDCESIVFVVDTQDKDEILTRRGPYPAFIGSPTREKMAGKMFQLPVSSRPLESAERLMQLTDWVISKDSHLYLFMHKLMRSRTDIDFDLLRLITQQIAGGSLVHRLNDHVTKRGTAHTYRPNITSHIYYSTDQTGRFSRGLDNYNIHFQGAIHFGFTIFQLHAVNPNSTIPPGLILKYMGHCCEEKLDDFFVVNDYHFPEPELYTSNPLLYISLDATPPVTKTGGLSILRYQDSGTPASAIASLLISRCIGSISLYQLGTTETVNPLMSRISIAEILGTGISTILDHIAVYTFLYLPTNMASGIEMFHGIEPLVFRDIAQVCLLREVYPEFCQSCGCTPIAEAYTNPIIVCQMIKHYLTRIILHFYRNPHVVQAKVKHLTFYPNTRIGIWKILEMWVKAISIATHGEVNLKPILYSSKIDHTEIANFLTESHLTDFKKKIYAKYGDLGIWTVTKLIPLQLSTIPPEVIMRRARDYTKQQMDKSREKKLNQKARHLATLRELRTSLLAVDVSNDEYKSNIQIPLRPSTLIEDDMEGPALPVLTQKKTRSDQAFRRVGEVSTTYYKILEILENEKIDVSAKWCITLAEGEGSIGRMLLKLGARGLYYNSLIDRTSLVPNRATSYSPACLVDLMDSVFGTEMCALEGGDLTDLVFMNRYIDMLPPPGATELVTCDAERTSGVTGKTAYRIMISTLRVCLKTSSSFLLFKTFCNSPQLLVKLLGMVQTIYSRVKVIVPHYSSHEGYEVYILGASFDPLISDNCLIHSHIIDKIIRTEHIMSFIPLCQTLMKSRLQNTPHQLFRPDLVARYNVLGEKFGFKSNLKASLYRLTQHNSVFEEGCHILEWLRYIQNLVTCRAINLITNVSRSYYGIEQTDLTLVLPSSRYTSTHTAVENYIIVAFNCRVLEKMLSQETMSEAEKELKSKFGECLYLRDTNEILAYTLRIDWEDWKSSYIRAIWRVWGHYLSLKGIPVSE